MEKIELIRQIKYCLTQSGITKIESCFGKLEELTRHDLENILDQLLLNVKN